MAKTIRVTQVTVPLAHDEEHVIKKACRIAGIRPEEVGRSQVVKQSIDARKKGGPFYVYTIDLTVPDGVREKKEESRVSEVHPVRYAPKVTGKRPLEAPIAVVGTGPAGLFCAYLLAKSGYQPLIFERGKRVEEREKDVARFWESGALDPSSNVQFGEGGAGTFSDGKLNTGVKDEQGRNRFVLETFVRFGAPEDILISSTPHIGSDILRSVVANLREEILSLGGRFFFSTEVCDVKIEDGKLTALVTNDGREVHVAAAVFAIGHSARDTFTMLHDRGVLMAPKPFAVGMRVEHPQEEIDKSRYGEAAGSPLLPPASYKLTYKAKNGRNVYTFCMCPGGYVINASSEEGRVAVNGMSERARDTLNANSAVIVTVTPEDFPNRDDPLSGIAFMRDLEERAYAAGGGRIPQQRFGDFAADEKEERKDGLSDFSSCTKGEAVMTDLTGLFPDAVREAFIEGMHAFSGSIGCFDDDAVILSAVESRTSSPVSIPRDQGFECNISGIYPCGEGAGHAGGITSAAMDGLKTAEALLARFAPPKGQRR